MIKAPNGLDGKSFNSILVDPNEPGKPAAYTYQRNRISMRTDRYRLIAHLTKNKWIFALFDHKIDPNEALNIADENPEIVKQLLPLLNKGKTEMLPEIKL